MDPMPLAGAFAPTREEALAARRHPLEWLRCRDCGLVNVWPDIPGEDIFADYSYRASDVPALRRHHAGFAEFLQDRFRPALHVEIGGNDGVLARLLPWPTYNVDPSDAWVGPGLNGPFTLDVASQLPKAQLVTASNSMAHVSGLADAMAGVRHILTGDGSFVMEVHDLDATLASRQWDTIYHEHRVEWSESSLRAVGAIHGLRLDHAWRLPLHGGLLRALFRPDAPRILPPPDPEDFRPLQRAYDEAEPPDLPHGSVAYGAAARATVYLDHVRPNVSAVIDGSPRRHGRYVPGLGLPILPPSALGDQPAALITAWTQADDIRRQHPNYAGRWVTAWR
jgi:hypothetical protein